MNLIVLILNSLDNPITDPHMIQHMLFKKQTIQHLVPMVHGPEVNILVRVDGCTLDLVLIALTDHEVI